MKHRQAFAGMLILSISFFIVSCANYSGTLRCFVPAESIKNADKNSRGYLNVRGANSTPNSAFSNFPASLSDPHQYSAEQLKIYFAEQGYKEEAILAVNPTWYMYDEFVKLAKKCAGMSMPLLHKVQSL